MPVKRELPAYLWRCLPISAGHNFDLRAKSSREDFYIQGGFFNWSAQKMTKYKEKLKYLNWSANWSAQKILSTRKKLSIRTEIMARVELRIFASRVSQLIFFSNECCTLLLWTLTADWIRFAIFRQAVKPHDGERIYR